MHGTRVADSDQADPTKANPAKPLALDQALRRSAHVCPPLFLQLAMFIFGDELLSLGGCPPTCKPDTMEVPAATHTSPSPAPVNSRAPNRPSADCGLLQNGHRPLAFLKRLLLSRGAEAQRTYLTWRLPCEEHTQLRARGALPDLPLALALALAKGLLAPTRHPVSWLEPSSRRHAGAACLVTPHAFLCKLHRASGRPQPIW